MWLTLRELTSTLPAGARILDVEPGPFTQRWFGRFNQFDYRTLGSSAETDYQLGLHELRVPKGICHLVICSTGLGPLSLMTELAAMLHHITDRGGKVLVHVTAEASDEDTMIVTRHLQEANFTVADDKIVERVAPDLKERIGLFGAGRILVCSPVPQADAPSRKVMGHHH